MSESYTLHTSFFDVVRTISLEISSDVNADSNYSAPIEGIGFEVPAVSIPDFGSLVMGLPPVVSIANPISNLITAEYLVFHKSVFGIYQDREVTIESSCIVDSDFVYPAIQIHECPESVLHPSSEIVTENYQAFHKSQFDIWKPFYAIFSVQPAVPSVSDVSPVCCVSAESVAQTIINYPYLPVGQTIIGNSDIIASSDIIVNRGDFDIGCSLVAPSIGITAESVAANIKEIKFGSFVLPHSSRKSEDIIKPIYNDRFNRLSNVNGVFSRPRAYERTITIHGETDKRIEYDQLHDQIGPKKALNVYGFYFPDCELIGLDIKQTKPGLDRYPYTATFIQRVFDTPDSASFDGLEFSNVVSVGDVKKSRIYDDKYAKMGIAEPRAYQASVEIDCITEYPDEYSNAEYRMGSIGNLIINGNTYRNAIITDISGIQQVGGGNAWSYTVSFNWFVFSANDSVTIDGIVLQNIVSVGDENKSPILTDSFTQKGISEPVAFSISRNIEFVDESGSVLSAIESIVGKSITAIINRTTHQKCKIAGISRYQPRGGGIDVISIDLIRYQYNTTDTVVFNGLTLSNPTIPNAMDITPSYSADMSAGMNLSNGVPKISRRFAAECITESTTEFEALVASIGIRGTLNYNGKSYDACYISVLSALQPRGGGSIWSYTIEFSRESGVVPVYASFNGLTLPNAILQSETPEILKSRTTLHNGKIAVDLGVYPSRSITLSCMSNSKSEYDTLYSWIGAKLALNVDGMVIQKAYIADLPAVRICGEGNTRLYTFDVTFEEETA